MDAEWDEEKRISNLAKHKVDFADAARVFDGPFRTKEERRRDYAEERFSALGEVDGLLLYVG